MATTPSFHDLIEPCLYQALNHWNEYSAENARQALILFEAFTPLKDAAQIGDQVLKAMEQSRWFSAGGKPANPAALANSAKELAEIQSAACQKLYDGYAQFLKTSQRSAEPLTAAMQSMNSPQQALANFLEASLTLTRQYQENTNDQFSNLSAIQAAYKGWFQKTLQDLNPAS